LAYCCLRNNQSIERRFGLWGKEKARYDEMKKNPTIRILTQSVLTTALSDYYYYTGRNCSSKYRILSCIERDLPDLSYLHLLRLCHKNRFTPDQMTEDDFEEMRREYQTVFLQRPKTWIQNEIETNSSEANGAC
jgi:hypothetical protein